MGPVVLQVLLVGGAALGGRSRHNPQQLLPGRVHIVSLQARGRPMECWTDRAREDLEALRILPSWARLAQDREAGRTKIHALLGHTQPQCWQGVLD